MLDVTGEIVAFDPEDADALTGLLRVYQQSIEPSEQKSPGEIAALVRDPRYDVLTAKAGEQIAGFAMSFFPDDDFWLLEYMAVDGSVRSRGTGRSLFLAAKQAAALRKPGIPCLLEVDSPAVVPSPGNDPSRRLAFYRSLGCRRFSGLEYILPLDLQGTPPPMQLLLHGLDGVSTFPRPTLARWLSTIYRSVYGQHADDPRIASMLATLPDAVPLSVL